VLRRFKRHLEWAKITTPDTFHTLRHTFASFVAMSRMDRQVIAEALGHTTTSVTRPRNEKNCNESVNPAL